MKTLIFATNNPNKLLEVRSILKNAFNIISLQDAGIETDIPEPFETLKENALEKARVINEMTHKNCFAEDTGLEVFSLNGEPGVRSARYSGEGRSSEKNIEKLLGKLREKDNREAQFKTIICLIRNGERHFFEGTCKGIIIAAPKGNAGFGYDPVFIPEGSQKTFAEMQLDEKNKFSHRKKAMDKLTEYLKSLK